MDVRIGVTYTPREIELELAEDTDRDKLIADVGAVLAGSDGVLWLTDRRGHTIGVPAAKVAFVEIGTTKDQRRVGFGVS
ncbi:MAG: DUF3107 domain-containing protein [Acidimicrobiales bacterium]